MRLWIISIFMCVTVNLMAQADSLAVANETAFTAREMEMMQRYEQRLDRYHRFFASLVPDFARVQFAGSTGLINVGCGWAYGKRNQNETDIMFGYVPKYDKESILITFTLRQTFVPWTKPLYRDRFTFQPLSCGLFVNSVLDSEYWTREPDRYPHGNYYSFSSKIRFHIFVGQRYTVKIPAHKRYFSRQASFVWELSTCDLYIVSKAINKTLPLLDILSLSFGMKYDF